MAERYVAPRVLPCDECDVAWEYTSSLAVALLAARHLGWIVDGDLDRLLCPSCAHECTECAEIGRENCAFHESRRSSHSYDRLA